MHRVELAHAADFDGWRRHARTLAAQAVPPGAVHWQVRGGTPSLPLAQDAAAGTARYVADGAHGPPADAALRVPRAFIDMARAVVLHGDPGRFELLYRVLLRLQHAPHLLSLRVDADVALLERMRKAVAHDMHRMHAYVRFRRIAGDGGGERFVAYYEPEHHIVEAVAPFFVNRYAGQDWAILTPQASLLWLRARDHTCDRVEREAGLTIGPGVTREAAPDGDELETLWRTYYASTFNPARINRRALQSHMPRRFWAQLPEAQLIEPLAAAAMARTAQMVAAPTPAPRRSRLSPPSPRATKGAAGEPTKAAMDACRRCPLWKDATQSVPGEGPRRARLMLVGEQPGDQEDVAGRPFVGPAGRLLDRALEEAGIDRTQVYVTNAVKHFKYELRGKRRLHKKPSDMEIEACNVWLQEELAVVGPGLVVAMGATALRGLTGRTMPVQANRGRPMPLDADRQMLVTVHPSFLLRVPPENRDREYAAFVADLRIAAQWLRRHGDG